jgi:hypothetical protein
VAGGGGGGGSSGGGSGGCGTYQTIFMIHQSDSKWLQTCTTLNNVCAGQTITFGQGVGRWPTVDEAKKALAGNYAVISLDGSPLNVYYDGITWHVGNNSPDGYGDNAYANWVATSGTHTVTALWTIISPRSSCTFTISK